MVSAGAQSRSPWCRRETCQRAGGEEQTWRCRKVCASRPGQPAVETTASWAASSEAQLEPLLMAVAKALSPEVLHRLQTTLLFAEVYTSHPQDAGVPGRLQGCPTGPRTGEGGC